MALQGRRRSRRLPTDTWFYYHLGQATEARLREQRGRARSRVEEHGVGLRPEPGATAGEISDEPDELKILKEINGFQTADPSKHLAGFGELKDDGSTTCASWIYCGCYPAPDRNLTARRDPRPSGRPGRAPQLGLGLAGQPARDVQSRLG